MTKSVSILMRYLIFYVIAKIEWVCSKNGKICTVSLFRRLPYSIYNT